MPYGMEASALGGTTTENGGTTPRRSGTLSTGGCSLGTYCKILRQSRGDGLHFWHWEIFDNTKWVIASGNTFGSRQNALRALKSALAKLTSARWPASFSILADLLPPVFSP